jgi:predicted Fe-Mo cluster-binding NifX family protein
MNTLIAVPSEQPGGLDAAVGAHFGHCELYTLVAVENNEVKTIRIIPNLPHEQGGCMAPVNYLAQQGVNALIAGGMGLRPLMGFNQVGIDVYHSGGNSTVKDAVSAILENKLARFSQQHTCGGGGDQHTHSCGNHQH